MKPVLRWLVRKFTNVSVDIFDLPQVKSAAEAHLSANGFSRSVFGLGLFGMNPFPRDMTQSH